MSKKNASDFSSSKKSICARNTQNEEESDCSSILDSDLDEDINPTSADVHHRILSIQSPELRALCDFLSDVSMINRSGDKSTNIVCRQTGKSYNIPVNKLHKFFKLLESCRRAKIRMMMNELQNEESSGIMLDFDIYQDEENVQLTDTILHDLCVKIIQILKILLNFSNKNSDNLYIGITRRPNITYDAGKSCYKDGFHILIPSIKVSRNVKKLIIKKLINSDDLENVLENVKPATNIKNYSRNNYLDINSAHVPTFFIGNSTKKGAPPYKLTHIYEVSINFSSNIIRVESKESLKKSTTLNLVNEFSLNFEARDGLIKKQHYEILDTFQSEVSEMASTRTSVNDDEANRNFGILSTNSIHDNNINELRDLLDTLAPSRYDVFDQWRDVVFALANTCTAYKDLAEYFSRKSAKFSSVSFEKLWYDATKGPAKYKKAITISSIHYWAKLDNYERYDQLRKTSVYNVLYSMVYEGYKEGILSHADIAEVLHRLLKFKFVSDFPKGERKPVWYEFILDDDDHVEGELYKWRRYSDDNIVSLSSYISSTLPNLFDLVFRNVKNNYDQGSGELSKYFKKVLENFKATMRKLGDRLFINNVISMAAVKFNKCGFSEMLDIDPIVRGVSNGVLKLGWAGRPPVLIKGFHSHLISKFTKVPYIAFNPYDPITKKILITLRSMFPDNESDTYNFTMSYLASTLDGNQKESMFMLMVGGGSNGKSFLVEVHKAAIGDDYAVKMGLAFLTGKTTNAENATPAVMQLQFATFAYYSESDKNEILNAARMKEITGQETLSGRKLRENMVNFKPKCHHLVTSNNDFEIHSHDHGTWRRIVYNPLKIKFVDTNKYRIDPTDKFQRVADTSISTEWTTDTEVRGRYLGYMVWMHYWLYAKYQGKVNAVPHPHVEFETEKYKQRQDTISAFIAQSVVKTADKTAAYNLTDEVHKYITWYQKTQGGAALSAKGLAETFQNSELGKFITKTARGLQIIGHRFLEYGAEPEEDETYYRAVVYDIEADKDNFGIIVETPLEYYESVCKQYDEYKHLFTNEENYNVDVASHLAEVNSSLNQRQDTPEVDNNSLRKSVDNNLFNDSRILPNGITIKQLPDAASTKVDIVYDIDDMSGFLPYGSDSEEDEDADNDESESNNSDGSDNDDFDWSL